MPHLGEQWVALLKSAVEKEADDPDQIRWEIYVAAHATGVDLLPPGAGYRVIHPTSGTIEDWTLFQVLSEVNRDHSADFSPYLPGDNWREGLREWTEWRAVDDPNQ